MSWGDSQWAPYVPVAQKKANAVRHAAQLAKKQGREMAPVKLAGRKIATTFWGQSWCQNLEAYSDYANRLPRGATYVRNGSVVDLVIKPRSIEAIVAGSETYKITINIDGLAKPTWKKIKQECSASIDSLLDLLAGRFSDGVMQRLTRQQEGSVPVTARDQNEMQLPRLFRLLQTPRGGHVRCGSTARQTTGTAVRAARCRSSRAGLASSRRRESRQGTQRP